jgi:hypothetical protein
MLGPDPYNAVPAAIPASRHAYSHALPNLARMQIWPPEIVQPPNSADMSTTPLDE